MRSRLLPALLATLVLGACSAGTTGPIGATPPPSTASSTPRADARTLRQFNLANGPADFTLPATTVINTRIDQPNVVTLTVGVASRARVADWLAGNLPQGWRVTAQGDDSLLFSGMEWQGAFTCSSQTCALTLRRQA